MFYIEEKRLRETKNEKPLDNTTSHLNTYYFTVISFVIASTNSSKETVSESFEP